MTHRLEIHAVETDDLRVSGAVYYFERKPTDDECVRWLYANLGHCAPGKEAEAERGYTLTPVPDYEGFCSPVN